MSWNFPVVSVLTTSWFVLVDGVQKLEHYFKGYLAGLNVVPGKTETDRVLKCLNNCKEKLEFHAMSEMQTGMVRTPI